MDGSDEDVDLGDRGSAVEPRQAPHGQADVGPDALIENANEMIVKPSAAQASCPLYENGCAHSDWVNGSDGSDGSDDDDDDDDDDDGDVADEEMRLDGEESEERESAKTRMHGARAADEVAARFFEWREQFPFLSNLLDNYDVLVEEMRALVKSRWCAWPERKLYEGYDQNGDWKVIPLLHTFPAFDASRTKLVPSNCEACPKTMELLQAIPGLRTVLFSRLGPKTRLTSHEGWADLSNYVLRCHLPLVVPKQPKSCGVWVEHEVRYHEERDFVIFDDSKTHKAFNASDEERVVLIFDIMRPATIPKGTATGGHTEQLDHFIAEFHRSMGLLEEEGDAQPAQPAQPPAAPLAQEGDAQENGNAAQQQPL